MTFKYLKNLPLVPNFILVIYCFIKKKPAPNVTASTMYYVSRFSESARVNLGVSQRLQSIALEAGVRCSLGWAGHPRQLLHSHTWRLLGLCLSPCCISLTKASSSNLGFS